MFNFLIREERVGGFSREMVLKSECSRSMPDLLGWPQKTSLTSGQDSKCNYEHKRLTNNVMRHGHRLFFPQIHPLLENFSPFVPIVTTIHKMTREEGSRQTLM